MTYSDREHFQFVAICTYVLRNFEATCIVRECTVDGKKSFLSILMLPKQAKYQNFSFLTSDRMAFLVSDTTYLKNHAIKSQ
jgi:hypothetical protein